jgi:anti-anti-sigma factor
MTNVGEAYQIVLSGEYDLARKEELRAIFGQISNGDPVTIDMNGVTYVDSTFLSELASMRLKRQEQPVTLVGVSQNIMRILKLAKLDRFFTLR